jgi:hypothetical protein
LLLRDRQHRRVRAPSNGGNGARESRRLQTPPHDAFEGTRADGISLNAEQGQQRDVVGPVFSLTESNLQVNAEHSPLPKFTTTPPLSHITKHPSIRL